MELKSASDVAVYARLVCCSAVAVYRLQCTYTHTHTHALSTLTLSRSIAQRDWQTDEWRSLERRRRLS